jgi:hypothetical protein
VAAVVGEVGFVGEVGEVGGVAGAGRGPKPKLFRLAPTFVVSTMLAAVSFPFAVVASTWT